MAYFHDKHEHKQTVVRDGNYAYLLPDVIRYGRSPEIDMVIRRSTGSIVSGSHHQSPQTVILVTGKVKRPSIPLTTNPVS